VGWQERKIIVYICEVGGKYKDVLRGSVINIYKA
jgi:hypothetical protein